MTRDEAMEKVEAAGIAWPEEIVDALESLGVLKLDKPITDPVQKLANTMGWPPGSHSETILRCALRTNRLSVVELNEAGTTPP